MTYPGCVECKRVVRAFLFDERSLRHKALVMAWFRSRARGLANRRWRIVDIGKGGGVGGGVWLAMLAVAFICKMRYDTVRHQRISTHAYSTRTTRMRFSSSVCRAVVLRRTAHHHDASFRLLGHRCLGCTSR